MKNDQNKRKTFLVDAKLQLSITLPMALVLVVASAGYIVSFSLLADRNLGPTSAALIRQGHITTAVFFMIAFMGSVLVGLRVTHRIAGPIMVIERAVRGLREGRHDYRLQLRKNDHMKSLASEVAQLSEELQARENEHAELLEELRNASWNGDQDAIRKLLQLDAAAGSDSDEQERRSA